MAQRARDQGGILQRAGADGHVGALFQQIDDLIGQCDVQRHFGMACNEGRDQWKQEAVPERHIGTDPYPAARRGLDAGAAFGLIEVGQDGDAALVEDAAFSGELQFAGGAVDQAGAQPLFQTCHQLADRRRRHAECTGGSGETAQFNDADEDFQFAGAVDVKAGHEGVFVELKSQMFFWFAV
ncbi:hypothetical protein D3C81_1269610 [compost metagenome]